MSENSLLHQAVALAKQGQRQEAIRLTKMYIREHMTDERGWYALAKLVNDEETKRKALQKVLSIDPNHSRAQALLRELNQPAPSFSQDPYSSTNTEEPSFEFQFENTGASKPQRHMPAARTAKNNSNLELVLGVGIFLFAIIAVIGLGYYAYAERHMGLLGLFGPDLDATATVNEVKLNYPSAWNNQNEDGVFIAWTESRPHPLELWTSYEDSVVSNGVSAVFAALFSDSSSGIEFMSEVIPDNTSIILMPVTPEVLNDVNVSNGTAYTSIAQYIEAINNIETFDQKADGITLKVEADVSPRNIAGQDGVFGYVNVYVDSREIDPIGSAVYLASFESDGQEYIFVLSAFGKDAGKQKRLAERILNTIEFIN